MKKKVIKKIGKFNLFKENVCNYPCSCGWNLWIGGKDKKDLKALKKWLRSK